MSYAESESMALKRLKVALKRKDWQMFEYGLTRTLDLLKSGTKISEIQEWYKVRDQAKAEKVPEEHISKLSSIIDTILSPGSPASAHPQTASPATHTDSAPYTPPPIAHIGKVKAPDIPFVIFIDNIISHEQTRLMQELRYHLNRLEIEPETKLDSSALGKMAKLIKSFDKTSQELNGLEDLLVNYPQPGIIITANYDSEVIRLLEKNNVDYSIDEIKKASTGNHWKIYPLGGMTSIFYCPACGTKSFYYNTSQTVISVCKKCNAAAYPDLYPVDVNNPQSNPKIWYLAYQALTSSENWLLISPPNVSEKLSISRLLLEATSNAMFNNAYIVSSKSEIGTWWRNKLEETNSSSSVAPVCFNVEILLNNYIQFPGKKST